MYDDFIGTYGPLARDIATRTGQDPSVVLGIIAQETGYGQHVLGNNVFGISPGGRVAQYPSVEDAANAYVDLIQKHYPHAATSDNPDQQAIALAVDHYNPNPNYGVSVADRAATLRKAGFTVEPAAVNVSGKDYSTDDLLKLLPQQDQPPATNQPAASEPPASTKPGDYSTEKLLELGGVPKEQPAAAPQAKPVMEQPNLPGTVQVTNSGMYNEKTGKWDKAPETSGGGTSPAGTYVAGSKSDMTPQPGPVTPPPESPGVLGTIDRIIAAPGDAVGGAIKGIIHIPGKIWQGGVEGARDTNLLAPEAQTWVDKNLPPVGYLNTHVISPVVGAISGNIGGATRGVLDTVASSGNAVSPGLGDAAAGMIESEMIRNAGRGEGPTLTQRAAILPTKEPIIGRPPPTSQLPKDNPHPVDYAAMDSTARQQALEERARTPQIGKEGKTDNTTYIPETQTPLPQRENTPENTAKYKVVNDSTGNMARVQEADNQARVDFVNSEQFPNTSRTNEQGLKQDRAKNADEDLKTAFTGRQSVSPQSVIDNLNQRMKDDGLDLRPAIAGPVQQVVDRLYKKDSNGHILLDENSNPVLEDDPKRLYAVRQSINDMLDRSNPNNAGNIQAAKQLRQIGDDLDDVIEHGSTGGSTYQKYRENYRQASKPLNEIEALRDAGFDDLKDTSSPMTRAKVQRVIDNLINHDNVHDVSNQTWDGLFRLRDDLARKESVISPAGNIKPSAAPPADVLARMQKQARPSVVTRGVIGLGKLAADYGLNALIGSGHVSPMMGTGINFATDVGANAANRYLAGRTSANRLNAWTGDLLRPEITPPPTRQSMGPGLTRDLVRGGVMLNQPSGVQDQSAGKWMVQFDPRTRTWINIPAR